MTTPTLLRMTAPLRDDFVIPYHDCGPAAEKPALALVAGLHGNELNGIFVLSRLAQFLANIADGRRAGHALHGRIIVVPAVNVLGVNTRSRRWPFDKTDINRMFPGYDAGETTQRIANAVLQTTRTATYKIDVHSSNVDFEELPQVRLYEPSEEEKSTAMLFGLPAVIERTTDQVQTSTLGHAWRGDGGESFVIQAGRAGDLQLPHCERLFGALMAFLHHTGLVSGIDLATEDQDTHYFGADRTLSIVSDHAGLFVTHVPVGAWLQAGALIGEVFDGFSGERRAEVRAPLAGLLSGIRRQPLLYEGDLVARLQTRVPTPDGQRQIRGQEQ
ncbi:MAG: M14 family metallopeptidase [Candidatus Binatia bacterium]